MKGTKLLYIPGWAGGRSGACKLLSLLRQQYEVEVVWLPEYADPSWTPILPADLLYKPALLSKSEAEDGPVTIIGWSTGGMAALEVAATWPSRVKSLVLLSPTAKFCADETRAIGSSIEELDRLRSDLTTAPERALRRFFLSCHHPDKPTATSLDAAIRDALNATPEQLLIGLDYLRNSDLRPCLNRVTAPTLILHGERDVVVPVEAGRELCASLPSAYIHTFIGLGHLLPDCFAEEMLPLITSFLDL